MFGRPIKFEHHEGTFGYITSDDSQIVNHAKGPEAVLAEIDRAIRVGEGGVQEISAEQYELEYVKKKQQPNSLPARKWREEISAGQSQDTQVPKVGQAVAAGSNGSNSKAAASPVPDTQAVRPLMERANLGRI